MPRKGEVIAGRYELEEELGAGAMGSVWRATHLTLQTPVAIKLIRAEAARNRDARARFEREALLAAKLQSAHVVRAIDHGHHGGLPYLAMDFLEGETLRTRLDARGRLSLTETARLVRHVARALTAAHEKGLVHRDVKPENVFVARADGEEVYKVLDFGVAKVTDELARSGVDPTQTGALLGTPFYLSPEQARGLKTLDHRADLWSLGVVAFECIAGRRPFAAPALGPLIALILHGEIPSLRAASGDASLPAELDGWVARALSRDPDGRFRSAREMADAFNVAAGTSDSFPVESGSSPSTPQARIDFGGTDDLAATVALAGGGDMHSAAAAARSELEKTLALPEGDLSAAPSPTPSAPKPTSAAPVVAWPTPPPRKRSSAPAVVATALVVAAISVLLYLLYGQPSSPAPGGPRAPAIPG